MSTPATTSDSAALAAVLGRLEARMERIETRLARFDALLDQATPMTATMVDILDDMAARAGDAGIDFDARIRVLMRAAERLTSPGATQLLDVLLSKLDVMRDLLDSGILAHAPIAMVSKAGSSLTAASAEPPAPIGLFGLLGALRDPDTARALGFMIQFARHFGRTLAARSPREALAAHEPPALPARR